MSEEKILQNEELNEEKETLSPEELAEVAGGAHDEQSTKQ
jgi:hypothetical protein